MYVVPPAIAKFMETWVAIQRSNLPDVRLLTRNNTNDQNQLRSTVESRIKSNCVVLTRAQICAEWFTLRQFRVKDTVAGIFLLADETVMSSIGHEVEMITEKSLSELMRELAKSRFWSSRSREHMVRGSVNEGPVMLALSSRELVIELYDCVIIAHEVNPWIACSLYALV